MNHKVNFHVKCYVFTFSCVVLAHTLHIHQKSSQKGKKAEKNLGKTMSLYFNTNRLYVCCSRALCSTGFMSIYRQNI